MIPLAVLNNYRAKLNALKQYAGEYAKTSFNANNLNGNSAEKIKLESAIQIIEEIINVYGEQAQLLDSELLEQFGEIENFVFDEWSGRVIKQEWVNEDVEKCFIKFGSDPNSLVTNFANLAQLYTGRTAFSTLKNTYNKSQVRWARVPTGYKTCDFCLMLASRGFAYHTSGSAGKIDHYHTNCDCVVVPNVNGIPNNEVVEGYDPDFYLSAYYGLQKVKELKKKNGHGAVKFTKPLDELTEDEALCVEFLEKSNFQVETLREKGAYRKKNIDLLLEDDYLVEMKNVTNESSCKNRVQKARAQFGNNGLYKATKVAFTTHNREIGIFELWRQLKNFKRPHEEYYLFDDDGKMFVI